MTALSELTISRLHEIYPDATYELNWSTPEQLLIATILAAQCTDVRVNKVTQTLFQKYPDLYAFANADRSELEEELKPTGYYRQKADSVLKVARILVDQYDGKVPQSMEQLTQIKGIARKTANVVLNCAFNIPSGIIVDTHVLRNAQRMGFSKFKTPEKIEVDLMKLIPQEEWTFWGPAMILHGRRVCKAIKPKCNTCPFEAMCPKIGLDTPQEESDDGESTEEIESPRIQVKPHESVQQESTIIHGQDESSTENFAELPDDWANLLTSAIYHSSYQKLQEYVAQERQTKEVFPKPQEVFTAFHLCPISRLKVVILGQDPYHDVGQAHGLSFSVKKGIKVPPSLVNMYKELKTDLGIAYPHHGNLTHWANQGVMMLNTVLTVRAHEPNSHRKQGWEKFSDEVIRVINDSCDHVVFVLWGKPAQEKQKLINQHKHTVLLGAHPSPLSAHAGFFGSKPYSQINQALSAHGQSEIDWYIPE